MTATDELRRLLDESGVEYMVDCGYRDVFWNFGESGTARASAIGTRGLVQMIVTGITPAQAIEATFERGECEDIGTDRFVCSKCGCTLDIEDAASCEPIMWVDGEAGVPRYCPNCGRKVKQ